MMEKEVGEWWNLKRANIKRQGVEKEKDYYNKETNGEWE